MRLKLSSVPLMYKYIHVHAYFMKFRGVVKGTVRVTIRIIGMTINLPEHVVTAETMNLFKGRLDACSYKN